jgi:hypothetical protein
MKIVIKKDILVHSCIHVQMFMFNSAYYRNRLNVSRLENLRFKPEMDN